MNQPLGFEVSGPAKDWSTSSGWSVGRSVCWVDESKTGGQATTQGCELTVVLPSFHSMSRPSPGRSRQQVAKRSFVVELARNPGKGWFLFTCQATSTQGGAFASCSHTALPETG